MNESIKSLIIRKLPILTNLVEDFKHYQIVKIDLERTSRYSNSVTGKDRFSEQ